jgi:CRP-like cAMP-binding protein
VEVVKDGVQIASVSAPGSVFGELAVLLDQPHTCPLSGVKRTSRSQCTFVARSRCSTDPIVAVYSLRIVIG